MNRDDIIRMARESGATDKMGVLQFYRFELEAFAALVEQHLIATGYRKCAENQHTTQHCGLLEQAVAEEREACARVCEETTSSWTQYLYNEGCIDCAAAIRARGSDE